MSSQKFLQDVLKRDANNFDFLRIIAAIAVIVGHSYAIAPQPPYQDGVQSILQFDYSGSLAVKFFFFLSGLLVTNSIIAKPEPFIFLLKRALRIFPGLLACLILSVFIVGPMFTSLPLNEYFIHSETWSYISKNFFLFDIQWRLTGVFVDSPYGLNGSLWTLPYEVLCYTLLAVFYGLGLLRNKHVANAFFVTIVAVSFIVPQYLPAFFAQNPESHLLPACFALGALFANNKEKIAISISHLGLLLLLLFVVKDSVAYQFLFYVTFFYSTLFISSLPFVIKHLKLPFDASYGIYIYGFMIQQCIHALFPQMGVHSNQLISSVFAIALGALSWHFVEKRFITIGNHLSSINFSKFFQVRQSVLNKNLKAKTQMELQKNSLLDLNMSSSKTNKFFVLATLALLAAVVHAVVLKLVFPGYYKPLSLHHSDFYIPAAFANAPGDYYSFISLLSWPRPIFMLFYKFIGYFGLEGSIACVIGLVCLNCALTALFFKRVFNLTIDKLFIALYSVFCFLLFSQPYFYTFYTQDIGSQLSYFFLLLGAYFFYENTHRPLFVNGSMLFVFCLLAFLTKETYALVAMFFAFLWFLYHIKGAFIKAVLPIIITCSTFIIAFVFNILVKSVFVDLDASEGTDYHIDLNPVSVVSQWMQYANEAVNIANFVMLLGIAYLVVICRNENKRDLLFVTIGCIIGAFIAWVPNAILPHHHYKGYSFNGLYLFYLPILFLPLLLMREQLKRASVFVIAILCLASPFLNADKYKDDTNNWVLIQENTQANLVAALDSLTLNINPSENPQRILVEGITFPFHPFSFPESIREFNNARFANFDVVNYNPAFANNQKRDLVTFIDAAEVSSGAYDQKWFFNEHGQLVKVENAETERSIEIEDELVVDQDNFTQFTNRGFHGNENGFRWTNGAASIDLNANIGDRDSLFVQMNTYMPSVCKNVIPKLSILTSEGKTYEPVKNSRRQDVYYYVFVLEKKSVVKKINISSDRIDASPDLRDLSFPFISLKVE
ncbi:MAG: acyltransferase [Nitrospirota bacterium]